MIQCVEAGFSDEEIVDALNVALVVGDSIVIPHLRHAVETTDLLREERGGRRAIASREPECWQLEHPDYIIPNRSEV